MKLSDIKKEYEDASGRQRFIPIPQYFERIPKLYSKSYPKGVKFSPLLQKLYSYLEGWKNGGNECYQSQETLSSVLNASRKTVNEAIATLEGLGLVDKKVLGRGFIYSSLPITDSHLSPPGEAEQEQAPPLEVVQVETETPQQGLIKYMDWDFFTENVRSSHDNLSGYISVMVKREHGREEAQEIKDFTSWYMQYNRESARQRLNYLKEADAL